MARYIKEIEAEAAIKDLFQDMPRIEFNGNRRRWREENEQYLRCLDALRSLPTADVRENVRAHWEIVYDEGCDYNGGGKYICGNCKHAFSFGAYFELCRFDYCPNCGAEMTEMRGEQN